MAAKRKPKRKAAAGRAKSRPVALKKSKHTKRVSNATRKRKPSAKVRTTKQRPTRRKPAREKPARRKSRPHRSKPSKTAKRTVRRITKAATHRRKPAKPATAHRKIAPRKSKGAKQARIEKLESELRATRAALRDVQRTPKSRGRLSGDEGSAPDRPTRPIESFDAPPGAITRTDSSGNEFIELPEYVGPTFEETDFGDFDFDDIYDDVGDEEEDSYGEDAS